MFSFSVCPAKYENFHLICGSFSTVLKVKLWRKKQALKKKIENHHTITKSSWSQILQFFIPWCFSWHLIVPKKVIGFSWCIDKLPLLGLQSQHPLFLPWGFCEIHKNPTKCRETVNIAHVYLCLKTFMYVLRSQTLEALEKPSWLQWALAQCLGLLV